jgi:hypothetical protein
MTHARKRAAVLGRLTFATALSWCGVLLAADPPAPAVAPKPAAAPPAPAPAAAPAPAPVAAPDATAPATPPPAPATPPEEEAEDESEPDSDASPAAPSTKPSPAMLFIQSRREAAPKPAEAVVIPDDGLMGTHQDHFHLSGGIRVSFIPNEGFDLFSKDNDLTQLSLGFGHTVFATGNTSLDASVLYDWAPSSSTARGAQTSLAVNRVSLGLEGRYHLFRRLYFFGRLAPGALRWDGDIHDGGADVLREAGDWAFSADLGGGAAFEIAGEDRGMSKRARGFVMVDGGYGWTTASSLEFLPEEGKPAPARLQPLDLGELAFRGGYFRVAAAVAY